MTTILRIKRRRDEEPLIGLFLDQPQTKRSRALRQGQKIFAWAGTVPNVSTQTVSQVGKDETAKTHEGIGRRLAHGKDDDRSHAQILNSASRVPTNNAGVPVVLPAAIYQQRQALQKQRAKEAQARSFNRPTFRIALPSPDEGGDDSIERQDILDVERNVEMNGHLDDTLASTDSQMDQLLPMVDEYLSFSQDTHTESRPSFRKSSSSQKSSSNKRAPSKIDSQSNGMADEDYVYDLYHRSTFDPSQHIYSKMAALHVETAQSHLLSDFEDSEEESIHEEDDEDSNDENYYGNDYPEDEDPQSDSNDDEFRHSSDQGNSDSD